MFPTTNSQTTMDELSDSIYTILGPGEIRLISISPRSGLDKLLLSLSIIKLEEKILSYKVLLYIWG